MSDEAAAQARAAEHNDERISGIMDKMGEIRTNAVTKDTTVETEMEAMKRDAITRNTTVNTKMKAIATVQTRITKIGREFTALSGRFTTLEQEKRTYAATVKKLGEENSETVRLQV